MWLTLGKFIGILMGFCSSSNTQFIIELNGERYTKFIRASIDDANGIIYFEIEKDE